MDHGPWVKYDFATYSKSRNFKNFTNSEKYFCDFVLRFINVDFSGDNTYCNTQLASGLKMENMSVSEY